MVQALWNTVWQFFNIWPSNGILGHSSQRNKNLSSSKYLQYHVYRSVILNWQNKLLKKSFNRKTDEQILVYLSNRHLLSIKMNYWYMQHPRWTSRAFFLVKKEFIQSQNIIYCMFSLIQASKWQREQISSWWEDANTKT